MENEKNTVPYIVHEAALTRAEQTIKKLWILCLVIFLAFVGSNIWWIHYEMSFEDTVTETVEAHSDSTGNAYGTLISGDNDEVHYGISEDNENKNPKEKDGRQ